MKKIKYLLLASLMLIDYSVFADNIDKENQVFNDVPERNDNPVGPFVSYGLQDIPGARGKDGGVGKND